jgi:hypothetical protein
MRTLLCLLLLTLPLKGFAPGANTPKPDPIIELPEPDFNFPVEDMYDTIPFTPKVLYRALIHAGIQNPKIVFRQAVLETGWFKSKSFKTYNNLFGMKKPRRRKTLCKGTAMSHGTFYSWYDSVRDYKLWQDDQIKKHLTPAQYYAFLTHMGYSESPRYVQTLKSLKIEKYTK